MKREGITLLILVTFCTLAAVAPSSHAFHPISSKLEFITTYPSYPEVDYGNSEKAQAVRRGEYLAQLGDCIACHTCPYQKLCTH